MPTHHLAAIMFTDIVGYTAMMQQDRKGAMAAVKQHEEILRDKVKFHQGELLQTYGDGSLSIFESASEAVQCAKEIQEQLRDQVPLRIGLHLGEITRDGKYTFGDGVNIASRIESMGIAGSVLLSSSVRQQIKNNHEFQLESLGRFDFKNVAEPMSVYALVNDNFPVPRKEEITGKAKLVKQKTPTKFLWVAVSITILAICTFWLIMVNLMRPEVPLSVNNLQSSLEKGIDSLNSIAVLRFADMSSEEDNEYFADGLAEELINSLSKLKRLKVASRTSSFSLQGKGLDAREIGKRLMVEYFLQGSVRKEGDSVRISIELIDAKNGFMIGSYQFDRLLNNVFALQDEICSIITDKLSIQLSISEQASVSDHGTINIEAYLAYWKGRYYWNKRNPADLAKAEQFFLSAIEEDSLYALAYSGLADTYLTSGAYGFRDPKEIGPKALIMASKAIKINPALAEGYTSIAHAQAIFNRNWQSANDNFQRAIQLNPKYPTAHHWYPLVFIAEGKMNKALDEISQALILDPLSPSINAGYGHILYSFRQYDQALAQIRQTIELAPGMPTAQFILGNILFETGQPDQALEAYEKAFNLAETSLTISALGRIYGLLGEREKALKMLASLDKKASEEFVPAIFYTWIYLGLGQNDIALQWLEKAAEEPGLYVIYLAIYPYYDPIRDRPEFIRLINKLGLKNQINL